MSPVVSSRRREKMDGFLNHDHVERRRMSVKDGRERRMYAGALKGRRGETGAIKCEKQEKGKVG